MKNEMSQYYLLPELNLDKVHFLWKFPLLRMLKRIFFLEACKVDIAPDCAWNSYFGDESLQFGDETTA